MKRDLPAYCYRKGKRGYIYFIRRGCKPIRIHAEPGTPEFATEYALAMKGRAAPPAGRSFKALIAHYRRSQKFERLKPRTRADYDKIMLFIDERIGDLNPAKMQRRHVIAYRDENAAAMRFANYLVQILRILFEHSIDLGWRTDNPARGISLLKSQAPPRLPWPEDKIAAFRKEADGRALLIFELCIGTGQRIGDVLRMRWNDLSEGGITVQQGKTGRVLWVPLTRSLKPVLESTPKQGMTIVADDAGRALNYWQARHAVAAVRAKIGAEAFDLHALRHTAAHELAALGCSDELIMAVTGHSSARMVAHYTAQTRQKTRAREAQARRNRTGPEQEC